MLRFICLLCVGLIILPGRAVAEARMFAVISDQTVLVHRLSKSACLVLSGAVPDVHRDDIEMSSLHMRDGFAALEQMTDAPGRSLLRAAQADGEMLARAASQIAAGDTHSVAVGLLLRNAPLVAARLEAMPTRDVANADQALHMVHALRVRTQRLQRDLCLLRIGLAGERARLRLERDVLMVPRILTALTHGDPAQGIPAPASIHLKVSYGKAHDKWKSLMPIVMDAAQEQDFDLSDVQIASVLVDAILANLNDAISLAAPR